MGQQPRQLIQKSFGGEGRIKTPDKKALGREDTCREMSRSRGTQASSRAGVGRNWPREGLEGCLGVFESDILIFSVKKS